MAGIDLDPHYGWEGTRTLSARAFICFYCGSDVSPDKGYVRGDGSYSEDARIYICHRCNRPTYIGPEGQLPGGKFRGVVNYLEDKDLNNLWEEARSCYAVKASTAVLLCCRKIIMNVAVDQGDNKKDESFEDYVSYLDTQNIIPKNAKPWVDEIRKLGNRATHELPPPTLSDAEHALTFTEQLLRNVYETPGRLSSMSSRLH